jgi:TldD protein
LILETATRTLLAPFELAPGKLERVFGTLAARRVDYADLYFQYARSEGWSLEEGIVKSGSFNIEQGVGVRAVSGEKTASAYSDEISFDALQDAAKATRAIAAAGQSRLVKAGARKLPVPLYAAVDPIASLPSGA